MASTTNNKVEMVACRPTDETEGSLLPPAILPTATALSNDNNSDDTQQQLEQTDALAAVPLSSFAYTTEVVNADINDQIEQEERAGIRTHDIHDATIATQGEEAPLLPTMYENENQRETDEQIGVARGKQKGKILSNIERDAIRQQNREINPINYHMKKDIERAKIIAKERDRSGVQIKEDKWFGKEINKNDKKDDGNDNPPPNEEKKDKSYGYEISDYETSDYNAGFEYQTTEYKSVYD